MMVTLVEQWVLPKSERFCRNDSSRQSSNYILYWCKFRRRYHEFGSSFTLRKSQTTVIWTQNKNGIYLKEG
jgi:hypothetical protein